MYWVSLTQRLNYSIKLPKNLVGEELTLADGSQLDPERILTKYSAVPQIRSVESVDVIMFIPSGGPVGNSLPVLQYQHGITSLKETSYAFALQHIAGAIQTANNLMLLLRLINHCMASEVLDKMEKS